MDLSLPVGRQVPPVSREAAKGTMVIRRLTQKTAIFKLIVILYINRDSPLSLKSVIVNEYCFFIVIPQLPVIPRTIFFDIFSKLIFVCIPSEIFGSSGRIRRPLRSRSPLNYRISSYSESFDSLSISSRVKSVASDIIMGLIPFFSKFFAV